MNLWFSCKDICDDNFYTDVIWVCDCVRNRRIHFIIHLSHELGIEWVSEWAGELLVSSTLRIDFIVNSTALCSLFSRSNRGLYIHRIGRSGRFGRKGVSNFVKTDDIRILRDIEQYYSTQVSYHVSACVSETQYCTVCIVSPLTAVQYHYQSTDASSWILIRSIKKTH